VFFLAVQSPLLSLTRPFKEELLTVDSKKQVKERVVESNYGCVAVRRNDAFINS
jgi:hypothetical protein